MRKTFLIDRPALDRTRRRARWVSAAGAVALLLGACGGGTGSLLDEAESRSEATCACETFECTQEHIAWFNRISIGSDEQVTSMSIDEQERYLNASLVAADCQVALRPGS